LSEETWKIVQAIVSLGKNLDMELIAEGIENLIQLRTLQTLRCEYGKGIILPNRWNRRRLMSFCPPAPWKMAFDSNVVNFAYAEEAG